MCVYTSIYEREYGDDVGLQGAGQELMSGLYGDREGFQLRNILWVQGFLRARGLLWEFLQSDCGYFRVYTMNAVLWKARYDLSNSGGTSV